MKNTIDTIKEEMALPLLVYTEKKVCVATQTESNYITIVIKERFSINNSTLKIPTQLLPELKRQLAEIE